MVFYGWDNLRFLSNTKKHEKNGFYFNYNIDVSCICRENGMRLIIIPADSGAAVLILENEWVKIYLDGVLVEEHQVQNTLFFLIRIMELLVILYEVGAA